MLLGDLYSGMYREEQLSNLVYYAGWSADEVGTWHAEPSCIFLCCENGYVA